MRLVLTAVLTEEVADASAAVAARAAVAEAQPVVEARRGAARVRGRRRRHLDHCERDGEDVKGRLLHFTFMIGNFFICISNHIWQRLEKASFHCPWKQCGVHGLKPSLA